MFCSVHPTRGHTTSFCPSLGDVDFDHLVNKVVSIESSWESGKVCLGHLAPLRSMFCNVIEGKTFWYPLRKVGLQVI